MQQCSNSKADQQVAAGRKAKGRRHPDYWNDNGKNGISVGLNYAQVHTVKGVKRFTMRSRRSKKSGDLIYTVNIENPVNTSTTNPGNVLPNQN